MEGPPTPKPNADTCAQKTTLALRVLETTDLHGHVRSYDYFTDSTREGTGLAALADAIAQARQQVPNCLLFDNGDFLQGTPLTQVWGEALADERQQVNPMIAAMNAVGYDAGTLGNHDFDFGLVQLKHALHAAHFPIVSANLSLSKEILSAHPALALPPWVMLEREMRDHEGTSHRLRIAVIGFLPEQPLQLAQSKGHSGYCFDDSIAAAQEQMGSIMAARPDLVIALAHTGIAPLDLAAPKAEFCENTALAIAAIPGIDVVLAGHDHQNFPDPHLPATEGIDPVHATLHGKPALNAGSYGSHLGVLDLVLEKAPGGGRWCVTRHHAELRKPRAIEAPAVIAASEHAHHSTLAHIRRTIGTLATPLHSYFALLGPDPSLTLFSRVQLRYAKRAIAGSPEAELPLLCATSSFKTGGRRGPDNYVSIPPGPLRLNHIDDMYLFNNTLGAIEITGLDLRNWLEYAARIFHQIPPGSQDLMLRDPNCPSYVFDVISGLRYQIDLSRPSRFDTNGERRHDGPGRIGALSYQGQPVRDTQRFVLLANSYRLAQRWRFGVAGRQIPLPGPPVKIRELLLNEVQEAAPLKIEPEHVWRFAPMEGSSVICRTATDAANHLDQLDSYGLKVTPLGVDPQGFLHVRLAL